MSSSKGFINYITDVLSVFPNPRKSRLFGGVAMAIGDQKIGFICDDIFLLTAYPYAAFLFPEAYNFCQLEP